MSKLDVAGNKITFDMTCDIDGARTTAHSEMTFESEAFTAEMTMDVDGGVITSKTSAKWVSDLCTDDDE